MSGTYPVSVLATDDSGIESIHFFVGDKYVTAASPQNGKGSIDTLNFANGNYVLRVEVTNFMGNTTTASRNIKINNGELSLSGEGSYLTAYTTASSYSCHADLTINDTTGLGIKYAKEGEKVLLLETSGTAAIAPTQTFSLRNGAQRCYNKTVTAEDRLGNQYEFPFRMTIDMVDGRGSIKDLEFKYRCSWQAGSHC